ncbi:hypothetical protein M0805_001049 [Coniferiporia weirii]|nr:hypothetical protein M0805_001049 [Coniferiporia weirii]
MADSSSQPHWHTIRPWSPRFLLTVREITSVSTTFVLSSTCGGDGLSSLGITPAGSDDEDTLEDALNASASPLSLVSDVLNRGLSVNVNGAAWKRVLMRMDDAGDEAIIVLYGLMPGRQYDVELGIVFGDGEEVLHSRMVTQPQQQGQPAATATDVADSSADSTSSTAPTVSATMPLPRSITLDEYATQLRAQLAHLSAERESVSAQIKASRREAHKGDAVRRNEIEALKRAAEKHAAAEMRGKQKVRALQEAAKQAGAAAREAEESSREVSASLPALRAREKEVTEQHKGVVKEAERMKEEADEALRADKKSTSDLQTELAALTTRLEKLQAKRERLSGDTLPELESQLARLIREVELVERDAGAFEVIDNGPVAFDLGARAGAVGHVGMQRSPVAAGPGTYSASTTPIGSPPTPAGRQAVQIAKSPYNLSFTSSSGSNVSGSSGSALSSRAPPFDPGPALGARLGPAFQLKHASALGAAALRPPLPPGVVSAASAPTLSSPPSTSSNGVQGSPHPLVHSHTQSWDVGLIGSNPIHGNGLMTSPGVVGGISRRPVSPGRMRQTSLPVHMPSFNTQPTPPR